MRKASALVLTVSFEPLEGKASIVGALLSDQLTALAYSRGASWVGTHIKEDRYVTTAHFIDRDTLSLFVTSPEHDRLIKQITSCCKSVIMEDVYET